MDNLTRLRQKYEDSVGRCEVCNRRGVIGTLLKLFDDAEEAGVEHVREGAEFYFRCADRQHCRPAAEEVLKQLQHS